MQAEIWRLLGNKGDRVPFNCIDGVNIAVGDFLELADNMVVTAHDTNVDTPIVGICSTEKVSGDGQTIVTGITNCIFKSKVDGAGVTIGDIASCGSTADEVEVGSSLDFEKGWSVGFAYTTAAGGETSFFRSTF